MAHSNLMKIKSLHIKNFKSLVDLEIVEPNPFTVFVGANGVGKSNIFEALEFNASKMSVPGNFHRIFGSKDDLLPRKSSNGVIEITLTLDPVGSFITTYDFQDTLTIGKRLGKDHDLENEEHNEINNFWLINYSRIFIGKESEVKFLFKDDLYLSLDGSNLEKVLKRLLANEVKRGEIIEYLQLLVPGLEKVEIQSSNLSGTDTLLVHEQGIERPFTKDLISDGTYNIMCLLTAIFQSDEPQFLCIEEPENGLNPFVVKELVNLFREVCKEKGHYIWLNTHSQSLVEMLTPDEIILVDKINGETKVRQIKGMELHGLPTDDAWVSGALGGGVPW
jgi:predicted ATPase